MKRIGIIAPLQREANAFAKGSVPSEITELEDDTLLLIPGVGAASAGRGARKLLDKGAEALVSWGTAGGLDPSLQPGDILFPDRAISSGAPDAKTDYDWRIAIAETLSEKAPGNPPMRKGAVYESTVPLGDSRAKEQCFRATGALAVDMESGAIGAVASEYRAPFLIVRVVCDSSDMQLPAMASSSINATGTVRRAALARSLVSRPGQLPSLLALRRAFQAAEQGLRTVRRLAGPRLAFPD